MARKSAGILLFRKDADGVRVLLVHPGGPYWKNKDAGAWSIPKGEHDEAEEVEAAARREFLEETGMAVARPLLPLGAVRQPGGKQVTGFACKGDLDPSAIACNSFEMEWPPKSGRMSSFPEVDRAEWFDLAVAREKINPGQQPFLDRLEVLVCEKAS